MISSRCDQLGRRRFDVTIHAGKLFGRGITGTIIRSRSREIPSISPVPPRPCPHARSRSQPRSAAAAAARQTTSPSRRTPPDRRTPDRLDYNSRVRGLAVTDRGLRLRIASASTSPPPTVPTMLPSGQTSILLPAWRGHRSLRLDDGHQRRRTAFALRRQCRFKDGSIFVQPDRLSLGLRRSARQTFSGSSGASRIAHANRVIDAHSPAPDQPHPAEFRPPLSRQTARSVRRSR